MPVLLLVMILSLVVASWILFSQDILVLQTNADEGASVELDKTVLARMDLRTYLDLDGTLEYGNSIPISPSASGVLIYVPGEGSTIGRGTVVFRLYHSISDTERLSVEQQVVSATAGVAQAELALANLNAPATEAQLASAKAAVAQAKVALDNLNAPATEAQMAAAKAAVAQAEVALDNLNAPSTEAQVASAKAVVAQAEAALDNLESPASEVQVASAELAVTQATASLAAAQDNVITAEASLTISRKSLCDQASATFNPDWVFVSQICPLYTGQLSGSQITVLKENMFTSYYMINESQHLLNMYTTYQASLRSVSTAKDSLDSATKQLSALSDSPTVTQIEQASESLKSAQHQLRALNDLPTESELVNASESLKSAQHQLRALDDLPTESELAHASESLKSAEEQLSALQDLPTSYELTQAQASLESAKAALDTALASREGLVTGESAAMVMFGEIPAWREFRTGMTPGEDVAQLKENLISLGYIKVGAIASCISDDCSVDQNFDAVTIEGVKGMQAGLDLVPTGRITFGDLIFLPGRSIVEYSSSIPVLGTNVVPGMTLVSLIPTERINTRISRDGTISTNGASLQRVQTSIPVSEQDLVDIGSEAKIELPDETVVSGTVSEIGTIAVVPQGTQSSDPYLEMYVSLDENVSLPEWTGAPVIVSITQELAQDVLAAPVTSLLALVDGGYALEVPGLETNRLVPIETGIYADGWVEVEGPGLVAGTEVLAPR